EGGATGVAAGLETSGMEETARLIRERGAEASTVECDASDAAAVARMAAVASGLGGARTLVNNAAVVPDRQAWNEVDEADWERPGAPVRSVLSWGPEIHARPPRSPEVNATREGRPAQPRRADALEALQRGPAWKRSHWRTSQPPTRRPRATPRPPRWSCPAPSPATRRSHAR